MRRLSGVQAGRVLVAPLKLRRVSGPVGSCLTQTCSPSIIELTASREPSGASARLPKVPRHAESTGVVPPFRSTQTTWSALAPPPGRYSSVPLSATANCAAPLDASTSTPSATATGGPVTSERRTSNGTASSEPARLVYRMCPRAGTGRRSRPRSAAWRARWRGPRRRPRCRRRSSARSGRAPCARPAGTGASRARSRRWWNRARSAIRWDRRWRGRARAGCGCWRNRAGRRRPSRRPTRRWNRGPG